MILGSLEVARADFEQRTGWEITPQGACKGGVCIPLADAGGDALDVDQLAARLGMALVHDSEEGLWALGPESGPRSLLSAELPDITLPDRDGRSFSFRSLRGTRIFMLAWASW